MLIVIFIFYESKENLGVPFRDVRSEISHEFSKLSGEFSTIEIRRGRFVPFFLFQITRSSRIMRINIALQYFSPSIYRHYRPRIGKPVVIPSLSNTRHLILVPFVQSVRERYTFGYAAMIRVISLEERSHSNTSLPYWSSRNSGYRRDAAVICDHSRVNLSVNLSTVVVRCLLDDHN